MYQIHPQLKKTGHHGLWWVTASTSKQAVVEVLNVRITWGVFLSGLDSTWFNHQLTSNRIRSPGCIRCRIQGADIIFAATTCVQNHWLRSGPQLSGKTPRGDTNHNGYRSYIYSWTIGPSPSHAKIESGNMTKESNWFVVQPMFWLQLIVHHRWRSAITDTES